MELERRTRTVRAMFAILGPPKAPSFISSFEMFKRHLQLCRLIELYKYLTNMSPICPSVLITELSTIVLIINQEIYGHITHGDYILRHYTIINNLMKKF